MKKTKRLFWRLYPSYLFIILIALLVLSAYSSLAMRQFFLDQTSADLEARAYLLEHQVREHLIPADPDAVDALCKKGGKRSGTRITVVLPSGQVIGDSEEDPGQMDNHSERPEINKALTGAVGMATRYSDTLRQHMMYVAVPLEEENKTLAVIRTSMPVDAINQTLETILTRKTLVGLIIALLSALICLVVSRFISRPIEEMRRGAEQFAKGNLTYRLPRPKSREMVMLASAMNQMATDLDDRIQTVSRQRNELEAVLSSMLEGVIAVDREERIISINQAAARMLHRKPSQLVGRTIQEIIRNPDLHRFVKDALAQESPEEKDIILYNEEGERILNTHGSSLCDANGEHMGTLIVFHDVTRLRRLENVRRDFAANVSHEIKTPLTAIKGFVETLRSGAMENPDEAARFLEIINKHADRLTAIVKDLMKLSEIEQKGRLPLESGNIRDVIRRALELCQVGADEKKIGTELTCEEDLMAEINAPFLEQAVVNLVDNAIKYSHSDSTVRVSAESDASEVVIRVEDQGIGIPKSHLPRLFERFYRVDKSRSRKQGGTGLGLAIVKHIIQAHGGYIKVESVVGKGSTFAVHLPQKMN